MTTQSAAETVPELLASLQSRTDTGARFIDLSGRETWYPYSVIVDRGRRGAAALASAGVRKGDCVAIILPTCVEFFDAFLGAQILGAIPAALYPPFRLGKLDEYWERTQQMLLQMQARVLVTDSSVRKLLGPAAANVPSLARVLNGSELQAATCAEIEVAGRDDIAFLQFSSGTTMEPKAVQVSHRNLFANLAMMRAALGGKTAAERSAGAVCWLPLYHDMGLVGCLYLGLNYAATVTYLRPDAFIARPAVWLQAISKYRAIVSAAPHFAYSLCLRKVKDADMEGVDLSSWTVALNGAEAIDTHTMRQFCHRFAQWGLSESAMTPVYGLAEAGLAVTFSALAAPPVVREFDLDLLTTEGVAAPGKGRRMPSVGRPLAGLRLRIVNRADEDVPQGVVGRILIHGPSVTTGYWRRPELTARLIHEGWLDTGDLGFLYEGDLYISGRAKDLIIIRGRNYAPQQIEELLLPIEGIRPGCAVAFGAFVDGQGEELVILAERAQPTSVDANLLADRIQARVVSGLALQPHAIEILPAGALPRTSSGKLRRSEAARQFLAGELKAPGQVNALTMLKALGRSQVSWAKYRFNRQDDEAVG